MSRPGMEIWVFSNLEALRTQWRLGSGLSRRTSRTIHIVRWNISRTLVTGVPGNSPTAIASTVMAEDLEVGDPGKE